MSGMTDRPGGATGMPSAPAHADLAARAADLRHQAEAGLTELADGASMCTIARSGRAFPGAKYHEGRAYLAAEVQRGLGRGADEEEALAAAERRWLAVAPPRRRASEDWAAYGEGGDDALAELRGPADR
jgi:hypothetical protein